MTDEVEAVERLPAPSALSSFVAVRVEAAWVAWLPRAPDETSLRCLACIELAVAEFRPTPEGFRRVVASSCTVLDFDETLGLRALADADVPVAADTGRRGVGMASCLTVLLLPLLSGCFSFLELLRFHDRLNLRLRVVMEDGVWGSSGLES